MQNEIKTKIMSMMKEFMNASAGFVVEDVYEETKYENSDEIYAYSAGIDDSVEFDPKTCEHMNDIAFKILDLPEVMAVEWTDPEEPMHMHDYQEPYIQVTVKKGII